MALALVNKDLRGKSSLCISMFVLLTTAAKERN